MIAGIKYSRLLNLGAASGVGTWASAVEGGRMVLMFCVKVEGHVHGAMVNVDRW